MKKSPSGPQPAAKPRPKRSGAGRKRVDTKEGEACPVVGVGASAGGLEAFSELLKHLPPKTGLAFAFLQHLDPGRESHLPEILARSTKMRVVEAVDDMHLQANSVYVLPPNASMSVVDGSLHVGPRGEGTERHLPIDHFFESLAAHRGNKAMGVVLSGNGSDGTLGLKAIKASGGITLAQTEETAKFASMPRSAVAAGLVDFVLSPVEIAAELSRLGGDPYLKLSEDAEEERAEPGDALKTIFKLLRTATGVDFGGYRLTTIQRRIKRRLTVCRFPDLEAYKSVLEKDPAEVRALYHDLLIHVTSFFREPETFAALAKQVFPELLKNRRPNEPIRIWLPGCSTGEEAYSLAISLVEFLGERPQRPEIQIFGTDVSEVVIETARKAMFDTGIEASVSPERLRRFFVKVDGRYQVIKFIRDLCTFARQNVLKDPPFSKLDLISCRNVLIYFEQALQRKLIPVFHYALKPEGFLLLGSAETASAFKGLFTVTDSKHKIFQKRPSGKVILPHVQLGDDSIFAQRESHDVGLPGRPEVWGRGDVQKEVDRLLLTKFSPPALVVDEGLEIIQFRGEVAQYLNPAPGEASLNLFKMTHSAFAIDLRSAILSARKGGGGARKYAVQMPAANRSREVEVEVLRLGPPVVREGCFVVLFADVKPTVTTPKAVAKRSRGEDARIRQLEEELTTAKEHAQALVEEHEATAEELRSANEEIQSSNEEMQSTNEELETAKEELQSTNEELMTLNDELKHSNGELNELNDDLNNLLRAVNLPVVMLGRDLRIRRFTPAAQRLFKLIATDVGRDITDINSHIVVPDLAAMVRDVIGDLVVKERELQDPEKRWYRLQVRPYETLGNKIAGAVLILFDIDAAKRSRERLEKAANYADAIIESVSTPLLVLDGALRVRRATKAFCQQFKVRMEETEGETLYDLGNGGWNIPSLRSLLEKVLPNNARVDDFKVVHTFPRIGKREMILNARRVESAEEEGEPLIILSFSEILS